MNEQPLNPNPEEKWEMQLQDTARALPYPPTPDIAGRVLQRINRPKRPARVRRILVWATIFLLITLCGLLAVPQVRARVLEIIIGAIHIRQVDVTSTPAPGPSPTALRSVLDLAGETTLAKAQSQVTFPILLPTYPTDLGKPDHVFLQNIGGPYVVLVWMDTEQSDRVRLSLHELGPGTYGEKGSPTSVVRTTVRGLPATWTDGPYMLQFLVRGTPEVDMRRLITGHVLLWAEGEITYRLETDLSLDEATRIAESLR